MWEKFVIGELPNHISAIEEKWSNGVGIYLTFEGQQYNFIKSLCYIYSVIFRRQLKK